MVLHKMRYALSTRIYKNGAQQSASGAVFQTLNSCAAHDWGQMLMFEGKIGPHFRAFTNCGHWTRLVNRPKVRTDQTQ